MGWPLRRAKKKNINASSFGHSIRIDRSSADFGILVFGACGSGLLALFDIGDYKYRAGAASLPGGAGAGRYLLNIHTSCACSRSLLKETKRDV